MKNILKETLENLDMNDNMWKVQIALNLGVTGEALNNEDNIGNVTKGRVIRLSEEEIRNAISGNMINHMFNKNLRALADKDELCSTCKIFSPMKNGDIKTEIDKKLSATGNRVKGCIIDDIAGLMNAGKGHNEKRTKTVNFSWGISKDNISDTALYSRVDPTEKNSKKKNEQKDTTSDANTNKDQNTQMLFHRPVRTSAYAMLCQFDLSRISFDDEKQVYVTDDIEFIKARVKKALIAYKNTILDLQGALCSTNMPHLLSLDGVITFKTSAKELMAKYSPLNDDFKEVHSNLSNAIEFNNVVEFSNAIDLFLDDEYLETLIKRNMAYTKEMFS